MALPRLTTKNDTILVELAKDLGFDLKERRLHCIGYIINLIAEQYLFSQDSKSFDTEFKAAAKVYDDSYSDAEVLLANSITLLYT